METLNISPNPTQLINHASRVFTRIIEQPSMAAILKRMERDGLIERVGNPKDLRSQVVRLTPKATDRLPEAREIMMQANSEALAGFSAKEAETLTMFLERVVDNLCRGIEDFHSL